MLNDDQEPTEICRSLGIIMHGAFRDLKSFSPNQILLKRHFAYPSLHLEILFISVLKLARGMLIFKGRQLRL